ncbi:MAG: hypothetical protein IIZ06_00395 [Kiritimatiellae bacterium]|nr:hypothetical protein [Kiritimatiellia bacterium]
MTIETNNADKLAARCATCACVAACKWTFRDYWRDKSHGGAGCNAPLTAEHAARVMETVEKAGRKEAARVQADIFAEKAENDCRFAPREWIVTHRCREYSTTAKTAAAAVNCVRFRLYGARPEASLPPFSARPKSVGNISTANAARRLARLTGAA